MPLHQLPTELPIEDIQYVITELVKGDAEIRQLIASGFMVLEYGAGQLLPGQPVYKVVGKPTKLHKESLLINLETVLAAASGKPVAKSVDWLEVSKLLYAFLQLWLQRS